MCDRSPIEGVDQDAGGHGKGDREGDPLWPLMPAVIEALKQRNSEAFTRESADGITPDEYSAILESICGATDDSQPVEQYDGTLGVSRAFVDTHQACVGQIQWNNNLAAIYTNPGNVNGARWCTGVLISDDLFLTAGHCFDQTGGGWNRPRTNGTSNIIPVAEIATNMRVNFNYQVDPNGNLRAEVSFPIVALVEYRLGGLDFAVVRLGGNPGATWGRATIATNDAVAGDMLCIIGHPAGVPKRIEAGPSLAPQGTRIRYNDIDTLGGNSGSAVLRASDGRVVGVHTNGGCTPQSPNDGGANFGVRIQSLIENSPTLQNLTRPPVTTIRAADVLGTLASADVLQTVRALDQIGTVRAADIGPTTRAALDLGGTLKFRDDVKLPALDKNPVSDAKHPAADIPGRFDPGRVINPGFGAARPFVLATPHHSMAWNAAGAEQAHAEALQAQLMQLQEVIAQQADLLAALEAEYEQLAAELEQMSGGQ